ncbi:S-layer homology domain-containing protein [Agathobaculum desmolans]|uniref:CAP and S-layer homology domain-containing protein n=1 Tax=Agathobaculum desmolans TaxID=39484 RepID=UPI00248DA1B4|nr:S-layer homology domain-containing protein [Agathobaculum desmolans]
MKNAIASILCAAAITCSAGAANVSNFSDVRPSDWYFDSVRYVCENGLMNGTSDTMFSPNATTSRGMIVTILYRLAGSPDMPESNWGYPYVDVDAAAYYSTPVYWARINDLVTGYSDDQFGPDDAITREQLTAMLYRYADYLGLDTDTGFIPDKYYDFSDYQSVSRYAANAMSWCVNKGIVSGSDGKLNPQETATRAEVATMLMNAESVLSETEPAEPEAPVSPDGQPVSDDTDNETTDDNQTVTDEISQRPTGKSAVDEYGGYWDYDLSNATFDAVNDLREENGLPRLAYSLQVQEWTDIRSKELVGAYRDNLYGAHYRPDGTLFATVGKGCNTENALGSIISASAQDNFNQWYGSDGHRDNMLNTRSKTSAVSIYVLGERTYAIQLFNILTTEELNQL